MQYVPGNRYSLFLATGQLQAPLAHDGLVAEREAGDGVVDVGQLGRFLHLFLKQHDVCKRFVKECESNFSKMN